MENFPTFQLIKLVVTPCQKKSFIALNTTVYIPTTSTDNLRIYKLECLCYYIRTEENNIKVKHLFADLHQPLRASLLYSSTILYFLMFHCYDSLQTIIISSRFFYGNLCEQYISSTVFVSNIISPSDTGRLLLRLRLMVRGQNIEENFILYHCHIL